MEIRTLRYFLTVAREEISITGQGTREPAEVPVRIVTLPAAKGTWGGERKKPRRAYTGGV